MSSGSSTFSPGTSLWILNMAEKHDAKQPISNKLIAANDEARHAAADEKSMSLAQAIKLYPKAVGWSVLLSSALIMEGYDLALLGSLYASPQFNMRYGVQNLETGKWSVPANWQSALSNGARAGEVLGLLINGVVSERYGYRKTMIASLLAMIAFIFILFFAPNVHILVIGEVFCGIPWGIFQTLTTQYASEVSPVVLRPYLTTFVNMCWVMGQFIAAGVNRGCVQRNDQWAYRIPFAVQWIWPVPIIIGVIFAPESPWWHIRRGNRTAARAALLRLTSPEKDPNFNPDDTIALIEHTNELEKSMSEGTSYLDCFKGIDLRRTEIVCCTWVAQTIVGTNIMGYFTYFMTKAGLPTVQSFNMSMISLALGLVGTMGSWFLMSKLGRRTIHFAGCCSLFTILIIVGAASFAGTTASLWAIGGMLILFVFVYDFTIGPVTYSIVSEMSSTRLKSKTIVLARALYNTSNIVVNVLTNYQLGAAAWNWGAKTAFFWAGTCGCVVVWVYFRLPEPKGRTYGELDLLFEQKVSARKFKGMNVDPYGRAQTSTRSSTSTPQSPQCRMSNFISHLSPACDACRKRKIKCNRQQPCQRCVDSTLSCAYTSKQIRGGNRGTRATVLNELRSVRELESPAQSKHEEDGNLQSYGYADDGTLGIVPVNVFITAYLQRIQHTVPFLNQEILENEAHQAPRSVLSRLFITSFCAYVATFDNVFDGLDLNLTSYSQQEFAKLFVVSALKAQDRSRIISPSCQSVFISFFLYGALAGTGNYRQGWYYLREATTLFLMCKEGDMVSPYTSSIREKLFWILLISERAHGIRRSRPITLQPTSETPPLTTPAEYGLRCLASLFYYFDDAFFVVWNGSRHECNKEWLLGLERDVRTALPVSLDLSNDQIANLRVSQLWLRIKLWELFPRFGFLSSESAYECLTFKYPISVAKDLTILAMKLPTRSLQIHGVGMTEKVFDIACALTDVLPFVSSLTPQFELGPIDYLTQTMSLLAKLPDGRSRFLPLLSIKLNELLLPEVVIHLREALSDVFTSVDSPLSPHQSRSVYEEEVTNSLYATLRSAGDQSNHTAQVSESNQVDR
ncbi:uncharacterized protein BDR25DRAFT_296280 [Lindgomyces ingoldianus]|uniref:Uncharacterized protein n=1 Tax=Lindgomyces ingoldianus TaxID=673940 RepID=A0ACB6QCF1_9PLEO|nr:uncharacterized protein BDR25DRAFT_296280 [Lindgomyces ingoldianus]KAF2464714.1 hypothetical protein BDR25DRAFT_296280 [Lindgomyces ingoldianus]